MRPYYPCAWNFYVDEKHLTTLFHADYMMMIHSARNIVTEHTKLLDELCGAKDPLVVARRKMHKLWENQRGHIFSA